jgi:ketosteroid isomerase-like protein
MGGATMEPQEALRALMAGWERGDPDAVAGLFTDGGAYEDPLLEERPIGPAAIRAAIAPAMEAIEDCKVEIHRLVHDGSTGFCEGSFTSRVAGEPTRFDFGFAALVEMRDGRIDRLAEYFDTKPLVP